MSLEAEIKVRVSVQMKAALARIASERDEDEKLADVVREAIRDYLRRHQEESDRKKSK